jgi:hypothetical protein
MKRKTPMTRNPPTDEELRKNAQQLAWLALGFFQALFEGKAKIVVTKTPSHNGSLIDEETRISIDWPGNTDGEAV